jgi:undecaprenyl diphosphate synthase
MKSARTTNQSPVDSTRLRVPRHVGLIPDGNRRWADAHGLPRHEGYSAGIAPGIELVVHCRKLGVEELSIYGFTMENTHRPKVQVDAFRRACVDFSERALAAGAAVLVIGDSRSRLFPHELQALATRRSAGDLRVNILVNYGWQWDLRTKLGPSEPPSAVVGNPSADGLPTGR